MFFTLDIYKAAYLSLAGLKYKTVVTRRGKLGFLFEKNTELDKLMEIYHVSNIKIGIFVDKVKELRSLVIKINNTKGERKNASSKDESKNEGSRRNGG